MNEELFAKCGCPHCENHIEFPIEAAGATVNCPHCSQPIQLSLENPPTQPAGLPTSGELIGAFAGPVRRTRVSFFYGIGALLVALVMVMLPLVYLAMIGAAGCGLYWFATNCAFLLKPGHIGRLYILQLLAYVGPLFIGAVLLFFMIKPLFARRAPRAQPLAMNPGVEPTLYAFIAKICDTIGAPMPKRIDLDCQLNASAGFRRGVWSMFGHDLVLTIGLPLVAGLSLREFAGVIAHEFGHFTQGFGMRLSYVIRAVNAWFARVVYERDAWDVWLEQMIEESEDGRITIVVVCARIAVGFSRLLLKLLMLLGHGVSCFLLRQMEYDADSYEIKLAGSETFEATARKLCVMNEALGRAYKEMQASWNLNRRLPASFPAYLVQRRAQLPPKFCEKIEDTMGLSRTGIFDTHPSDGDRIRRARRAGESGVFHLDYPATVLFSNFEIVAKQVTQVHYSDDLGLSVDSGNLRATRPSAALET
jgi:Zn-dependent protease with chaperone function